jgi:hypothetical protein
MWAAISSFLASRWLAIVERAAIIATVLGMAAAIYRAGAKSEENRNIKEELRNAKENLAQDGIVAGNDDVDGMRTKLSEALRRKRNT